MIYFTYHLGESGWADADISEGSGTITVSASYTTEALGDFLSAVTAALTSGAGECSWDGEPQESRWQFSRTGNTIRVRLLKFDDIYRHVPESEGRLLFDATDEVLVFAAEVDNAARAVLHKYGEAEYLRRWASPFPMEQLKLLVDTIVLEQSRRGSD